MKDQSYLARVATELWLLCWTLCEDPELKRLCLVCRYFTTLCQPLLFRNQCFYAPDVQPSNWIASAQILHRTVHRLKKLASSPHALSVRGWRWEGNPALNELPQRFPHITNMHVLRDTWLRLESTFFTTLGAYQRLTSLMLTDLTIDTTFRSTLSSLKLLEDLVLLTCEITARTGDMLPVRRFHLQGPDEGEERPLRIVAADNLKSLHFVGSPDCVSLLVSLKGRPLPVLVSLVITTLSNRVARHLFVVLAACPQLQSLHIFNTFTPDSGSLPDSLPDTTIPALRSFHGPSTLVSLFVRNRPVVDIKLVGSNFGRAVDEMIPIIHAMTQTSASVRYLAITQMTISLPDTPRLFAVIRSLLPELRGLNVALAAVAPSWSADGEDSDQEAYDSDDSDDENAEPDNREVELWDGSEGSSDEKSSLTPNIDASVDVDEPPIQRPILPVNVSELPGYMYVSSEPHPPVFDALQQKAHPASLMTVMNFINAGTILLPPLLEYMHFHPTMSVPIAARFPLSENHRAVLSLETLLPGVKELSFGSHRATWVREQHVWKRVPGPAHVSRATVRIISQVWSPDGTRRQREISLPNTCV